MAGGEKYTKWTISQVSRADGVSLDQYYWLPNSFQYAENVNTDDEMHGLKLAQKMSYSSGTLANNQLISAWNYVIALDKSSWAVKKFDENNWSSWGSSTGSPSVTPGQATRKWLSFCEWVIFQDHFWYGTGSWTTGGLVKLSVEGSTYTVIVPRDHVSSNDEDIMDPEHLTGQMGAGITAILNYNNSRLVVAVGQDLWVYYPELEAEYNWQQWVTPETTWKVWWKKVMSFENGSTIIALTCTFEYLKVWVQDEWWNTKVYYYQGNNNLKSTFVYNVIDLTGTKVLRVYSINSIDYYVASLDGTDGYVTFNKMIGNTPVMLLKQRAGLSSYDVNYKDPYFVWPCGMDAPYNGGNFYVADAYGIWKFQYDATSYDKGYMKWNKGRKSAPSGVAVCKNFLYFTDQNGIYKVRLYDTGIDWYQDKWILISRELEGDYGGCVTKMLDEVRMHYELLPEYQSSTGSGNGSIDIYVSPNNSWRNHDPESDSTWRRHVMHIDGTNFRTRTEQINALNSVNAWAPAFEFDWQTITYCIIIKNGSISQATPIVRELRLQYQLKGKTNNIYEIQNS